MSDKFVSLSLFNTREMQNARIAAGWLGWAIGLVSGIVCSTAAVVGWTNGIVVANSKFQQLHTCPICGEVSKLKEISVRDLTYECEQHWMLVDKKTGEAFACHTRHR